MIGYIKRVLAKRRHAKIIAKCRKDGHFLQRSGEMTPARMVKGVPVVDGPPEFGFYSCENGCGYTEANTLEAKLQAGYTRTWDEAEALKKKMGEINVKKD